MRLLVLACLLSLSCTPDDVDGDGWGAADDCDDNNPEVRPDAEEVCNGLDDDCDGLVDPRGAPGGTLYYPDRDADGWGVMDYDVDGDGELDPVLVRTCAQPPGFVTQPGDCDDDDDTIYPGQGDCPGA